MCFEEILNNFLKRIYLPHFQWKQNIKQICHIQSACEPIYFIFEKGRNVVLGIFIEYLFSSGNLYIRIFSFSSLLTNSLLKEHIVQL